MDPLSLFGFAAVTLMLIYALEASSRRYTFAFAGA